MVYSDGSKDPKRAIQVSKILRAQTRMSALVFGLSGVMFLGWDVTVSPALAQDATPPAAGWEGGWAGDDTGWYVEARVGYSIPSDSDADSATTNQTLEIDPGFAGAGALGHDFDGFFRTEFEFAYRDGDIDSVSGLNGTGSLDVTTYMANFIAELESPDTALTPFVGIGLGAATIDGDGARTIAGGVISEDDTAFAYQGIAGLAYAVNQNLAFTGSYSYVDVPEATLSTTAGTSVDIDYAAHSLMVGLRWSFPVDPGRHQAHATAAQASMKEEPKPAMQEQVAEIKAPEQVAAAPTQPEPVQPKPPEIIREFIVFFDWDDAKLTSQALQTIADAAQYAQQGDVIKISVTGHADRSGPSAYNLKLAQKRADAVKGALVAAGFPAQGIVTVSRGEQDPLVATADGVKEAQNRRALIVLE